MSTKKNNREQLQLLRDEALEQYLNREDFQYNMNADALYRQYKDRYLELGKSAMVDTMGQAAALTGGYGSSYAQNVGQQAYQGYLQQLSDVVPELYKLAYDRYQAKGDKLYKTYQSWAQLEQQAADQEQLDREYALAEQKRLDANAQAERERLDAMVLAEQKRQDAKELAELERLDAKERAEQERQHAKELAELQHQYAKELATQKHQDEMTRLQLQLDAENSQNQTTGGNLPDYYSWLSYYQGKGERPNYDDPTIVTKYDNQNVSTGNIMTMQRVLGQKETGMWTFEDQKSAGGMTADEAWAAYQKGQLQNRNSHGMGDMGLSNSNVMIMERVLGLREDGYWSDADKKAAGGMSEAAAWQAYQQGKLQWWR